MRLLYPDWPNLARAHNLSARSQRRIRASTALGLCSRQWESAPHIPPPVCCWAGCPTITPRWSKKICG